MIEIRYSTPNDLEISGTASDFEMLEKAILDLSSSTRSQLAIDTDPAIDPSPYMATIPKLVVVKSEGPTLVSLAGNDTLFIKGSLENLASLASFFHFEKEVAKGDHSHYEYYDGNIWIDPNSIPLVISVR